MHNFQYAQDLLLSLPEELQQHLSIVSDSPIVLRYKRMLLNYSNLETGYGISDTRARIKIKDHLIIDDDIEALFRKAMDYVDSLS